MRALGLAALHLAACSAPNGSSVWHAKAPQSTHETGLIVQSDARFEPQLTRLLQKAGGSGRILSQQHHLFEVFGVSDQAVRALGSTPGLIVEKNRYLPNLLRELSHTQLARATDPRAALAAAGFHRCRRDLERLDVVLSTSEEQELKTGVTEQIKTYHFNGGLAEGQDTDAQGSPLRKAFILSTPELSQIKDKLAIGENFAFTPDVLGVYRVSLLVQNENDVCGAGSLEFTVTANPKYKGPQNPTVLSPQDLARFRQIEFIDAAPAWQVSRGKGALIAIIDTGVNYNHPDLANNIYLNSREIPDNQIDDDGNGFVDDVLGWDFINSDNAPFDDEGHGSHVAGLAASAVTGVAPEASILAVKALNAHGGGDVASLVAAVYYAVDRGATVINGSFGSTDPSMSVIDKAVAYAEQKGVVFVAASGNGDDTGRGVNNDLVTDFPSGLPRSNIVAVAATDGKTLTSYSNYGAKKVHVAAPGGSLSEPLLSTAYENPYRPYLAEAGTSMAAPIVTGVVALGQSLDPSLKPKGIVSLLVQSGIDEPSLVGKVVSQKRLTASDFVARVLKNRSQNRSK